MACNYEHYRKTEKTWLIIPFPFIFNKGEQFSCHHDAKVPANLTALASNGRNRHYQYIFLSYSTSRKFVVF